MGNSPFLKIHSCNEDVVAVDYIDIDYTSSNLFKAPFITATTNTNVSVFVSNITQFTARLNFSSTYTGKVYYTVMSTK